MRVLILAITLSTLMILGGCSNEEVPVASETSQAPAARVELTPEELGELGARIEKNPSEASRLLSEKGLDEGSFEQAIRKVSEDPAASQQYAEAYRRTNSSS